MNAQNAREYMPLVQALADGRQLQHKNEHGEWVDIETIVCVAPQKLRIKPEPRTFDVWRNEKTKRVIAVEDGDRDKDEIFSEWERITVQEVIK